MKNSYLKAILCHFLSLALFFAPLGAHGQSPSTLESLYHDPHKILDESEELAFINSSFWLGEDSPLFKVFNKSEDLPAFQSVVQDLGPNEVSTSTEMKEFYVQTLFLFRLLKAKRMAVAEARIPHWLVSLDILDFRKLSAAERTEWMNSILHVFTEAVERAGPWSKEDGKAAHAFLRERAHLVEGQWLTHINRAAETSGSVDAKKSTEFRTGIFAIAFMLTGALGGTYLLGDSGYMEYVFEMSAVPGFLAFLAGFFSMVIVGGGLGAYVGIESARTQFGWSFFKHKATYTHEKIGKICESLLKGTRQ